VALLGLLFWFSQVAMNISVLQHFIWKLGGKECTSMPIQFVGITISLLLYD
jgi:putative exporter of polyketide antibiotics